MVYELPRSQKHSKISTHHFTMSILHRSQWSQRKMEQSNPSNSTSFPFLCACKLLDSSPLDSLMPAAVSQRSMILVWSAATTPRPHSPQMKNVKYGPVGFQRLGSRLSMHLSR